MTRKCTQTLLFDAHAIKKFLRPAKPPRHPVLLIKFLYKSAS
jgi:hypothetical protein